MVCPEESYASTWLVSRLRSFLDSARFSTPLVSRLRSFLDSARFSTPLETSKNPFDFAQGY